VAKIVRAELAALGAEVSEDDAAERLPAGCGNILGRFPPTVEGGVPIAFAAHLDTVPQLGPIEVELLDGMLRNRHPTILGSDNKAAVAAMLVAVQRVVEEGRPHAGIEILLTPCEEIGLKGGAFVDTSRLRSRIGFVYDHTGDVGDIIGSAPSLRRIEATFLGRAAHAGIVPEAGRNAIAAAARAIGRMSLGRIDADTTANVGLITGGTAANVVPELCTLVGEARSRDERALAGQIMAMLDALAWAASEGEVDLQTRVHDEFTGYRLSETDQQVRLAWRALEACGHRPRMVLSGGGSDVNALLLNGFPCVNLCNGSTDVHTPQERISVQSLTDMVEVTLAIIDAARVEPDGR
jgi:tripeptide aminopeptidase